jgi:hypothetical protein
MCVWTVQQEHNREIERVHQLMSEDCDCKIHRLDQTERTKLIDAAIDATNAEAEQHGGHLLATFDDDWELAPLSRTRCVERGDAEYWYRMGGKAMKGRMLVEQNADMREMLRVGRERMER